MARLLLKNGCVLTMDERATIHSPGWVWIERDRIRGVGAGSPPETLTQLADRVIDATGMAVMPGLVNGHTHLEQVFMRGLGDGLPLLRWLKEVVWPMESAMTPEEVHLAARLSLLEYLKSGVTAVVQHHKVTASLEHVEAAARAAEKMGLRLLLARMWADVGDRSETPDKIFAQMEQLRQRWHGASEGRITIGFGPAVPWRCSDETMRRNVKQARAWGIPTHIHIAETKDEIAILVERTGKRQIEWLDSLGVLGPDCHLIHCVQIDDSELDLMAKSGAVVVHCPISNMFLASGIAPVRRMLDRSIPVALGTDGAGAGGSQDMLENVKAAVLLAKVSSGEPNAVLPMAALNMATSSGAKLLGRNDLGRLTAGAVADVILAHLDTVRATPVADPASALVYSAVGPDVHTVIVDGQVLVQAGRVQNLDEQELLNECEHAARRLRERVGVER